MSEELKPCPFCGESPRLDQRQTQSLWSSDEVTFSHVACDECEVSGQDFCDDHDGEQAIEWWNTRATPPAAQVQGECNCPGFGKQSAASHAPNCPARKAQVQGEQPEVVGQLALDEPFNGTEGLEIGEWEFVPERAVVESMLAESTGEMVPLMTVAQHQRIVAALEGERAEQWRLRRDFEARCDTQAAVIAELRAALSAPHEQAELWAVHVEGPDDLYAAFSQEDAERHANELNAIKVPDGISISAVVIPSPWGAVEHWQYLAEQEREHVESMRAALATPPAAGVPEGWKAGFEWHEIKDALAAGLPEPDAWLETCDGENMHPVLRSHPMVWHSFYASRFWPLYRPGSLPAALTPPASEQQTAAARDVLAERRRQVEKEGWTPEHDEEHDAGVLAAGAAAYALNAADQLHPLSQGDGGNAQPSCWPWAAAYWKPGAPRRDLVKAGALILAEIERWDRMLLRLNPHLAGVNQGVTTEAGNGGDA